MNRTLPLIAKMAGPVRGKILALLVLTAAVAFASAAPAYLMRTIIDGAIARHESRVLALAVVAMLANAVLFALLGYAQGTINIRVSQAISRTLRLRMADQIYRVPMTAISGTSFGSLMTRLSNDVDGLEGIFSGALVQALSNGMQLAIGLLLLMQFSWQLGLMAIVVVPAFTLPLTRMGRAMYDARLASRAVKDRFNTVIAETLSLSGLAFIKSHVAYEVELRRLTTINDELQGVELRANAIGLRYSLFNSVATMATPALMWFAGFWLVELHAITLGALLASITLILRLFNPATSLASLQLQLTGAGALSDRLRELLDLPCETSGSIVACDQQQPRLGSAISFENVELRFGGAAPNLSATFRIEKGETVAFCGASGAGKTSLAKTLIRLAENTGGTIRLDGTDVRDIDVHELRRRVAMVAQEPFLLNDSIAENVALGLPSAGTEQIADACRLVGLSDFVDSLPDGYATSIGDRGMRLSGGQRQRIALARLFLRNPAAIVLDEATSALDVESERAILRALRARFPQCPLLVITHRQSTIEVADRAITLRDGHVEELSLLEVA